MKMHDNNLILVPHYLADHKTPIVINNACVSWHRLAGDSMFAGARAYVGTLFEVTTSEAEEVLLRALRKHHGKSLSHAFWAAQREIYDNDVRRPYVVAGVYPQRLRTKPANVPAYILAELRSGRDSWLRLRDNGAARSERVNRSIDEIIEFFERNVRWFERAYTPGTRETMLDASEVGPLAPLGRRISTPQ